MKKFSFLLVFLLALNFGLINAQQLVINEIMSSNATTIQDEDGDYSDWIEFFNTGRNAVNLGGYAISDDPEEPEKWIFPSITLHPGEFLLVFASDKNRLDTTELHTNFKIKNEGEDLILSNPEGEVIDHFDPVVLATDVSFGRYPDGSDNKITLSSPSPGAANFEGTSLYFSRHAGFYLNPFKLFIHTTQPGDTVFYTTDGSIPDTSSFIFTDSIQISNTDTLPNTFSLIQTAPFGPPSYFKSWTPPMVNVPKASVIRAAVFRKGEMVSQVESASYFVDTAIFSKYHFPIISLTTDSNNFFDYDTGIYVPGVHWDSIDPYWTGNYFINDDAWERLAHFEYFTDSGFRALNQDVGVCIHGKSSRSAPQKTLRIYARSEYGNSYLNYPFMLNNPGQDKYKRLLLRSIYSDLTQSIFKDEMTQDLVKHLDLDMQYYAPVVVFVNGEYWGLQVIRDRIDCYYLGLKYDIDPECIDLLENNAEVIDGSSADYLDMIAFIENHDLSVPANYEYITTRLDIENFIDYNLVEIYFGNIDWPGSNVKYWRQQTLGAKWRWIMFDLDFCYHDFTFDNLSFATYEGDTSYQNPTWATFLLRNLLKSEEFKGQFINRFAELLNTTFQPDSVINKIDKFITLYTPGINFLTQRWNFPRSVEGWQGDINWILKRFANERPCYMQSFILDYFDLEASEFPFDCSADIEKDTLPDFSLFPNPAISEVILQQNNFVPESTLNIEIVNQIGIKVIQKTILQEDWSHTYTINISDFKPGMYIIRVSDRNKSSTFKFIKTNN